MNRAERRAAGALTGNRKHPTVELAYIHPGEVSAAFMNSVLRCRDHEVVRTGMLFATRERRARSGSIAKARNEVTTMFTRSQTEWLWFVDADMGFPANALERLLRAADARERPLMGGLCFAHRTEGFDMETNAEIFGCIPTLSLWHRDDEGRIVAFSTVEDYPRDTVCRVHTTGAACILIHRTVLETIEERFGRNWWSLLPHPAKDNESFSEDTSFFIRADACGFPLFVDTGTKTSHDKGGVFLTEALWDQQQATRSPSEQVELKSA